VLANPSSTLALCFLSLAALYRETGKAALAEQSYRQAQTILDRLVRAQPGVDTFRRRLSGCHFDLAGLYRDTGRLDRAEPAYRQALPLMEQLVRERRRHRQYQMALASDLNNLGSLYRRRGQADRAVPLCRRAAVLWTALARALSWDAEVQDALGIALLNLPWAFFDLRRYAAAEEMYLRELEVRKQLVRAHPDRALFRRTLAVCFSNLGVVYRLTARPGRSERMHRQARDLQ
jgi:tetratricopeptide (TPR) repeat protein